MCACLDLRAKEAMNRGDSGELSVNLPSSPQKVGPFRCYTDQIQLHHPLSIRTYTSSFTRSICEVVNSRVRTPYSLDNPGQTENWDLELKLGLYA